MIKEIIEIFIDRVGNQEYDFNDNEKDFLMSLVSLSASDKAKIFSNANEEEVFNKICDMGYESAIISIAEKIVGYKYLDIRDVKRNVSIDNIAKSQTLADMGVFSTIVDNDVIFVISKSNQIEAIKENCDVDNFNVFINWPWVITKKNIEEGLIIQGVSGKNQHVIMATGQMQIDNIVKYFNGFVLDKIVQYRRDLISSCREHRPDILVVSDSVGGNEELISILIKIKAEFKDIRIIYFTSEFRARDDVRKSLIGVLIRLGVYDIKFDNKFSVDMLKYLLSTPSPYSAVKDLDNRNVATKVKRKDIEIISNDEDAGSLMLHSQANVYSIISSKGGTGKSFIAGNIAKAIAKYGIPKDGKKPRVAIIDGDFFGGGISNLFNISEKKKNIITAIKEVSNIMTNGRMTEDQLARQVAIENIKESFVQIPNMPNMFILPAYPEQLTEKQFDLISGEFIQIIVESIIDEYDIVIVDITGDFELKVWYPMFVLSRNIFSIVEMEYNSVYNAIKQKSIMNDFVGNASKVQYIFNKVVKDEMTVWGMPQIRKDIVQNPIAEIPYLDRRYMINNAFECKWLVDNDNPDEADVKFEILKMANTIWPIKDISKIKKKVAKIEEKEIKTPYTKPKNFKELLHKSINILFPFAEEAENKVKMMSVLGPKGIRKENVEEPKQPEESKDNSELETELNNEEQ